MDLNCICCGELITRENNITDNGVTKILKADYGSKFHGDIFQITICDNCLGLNQNIKVLHKEDWSKESIEKMNLKLDIPLDKLN